MPSTLTWPLRLTAAGSLATAEQDSVADIESCVTAILSYPAGWRDSNPAFGRPQVTFRQGGIDINALTRAIQTFEPRATPEIVAGLLTDGEQKATVNVGVPA